MPIIPMTALEAFCRATGADPTDTYFLGFIGGGVQAPVVELSPELEAAGIAVGDTLCFDRTGLFTLESDDTAPAPTDES